MNKISKIVLGAAMAIFMAGSAQAANIAVSSNIATSTTWTADNIYNLTAQIYVLPGATLTIQAGTLVQSTANSGGSLAVTRGAKIYVNGTKDQPVIMTSTNDDLVTWREVCNEWGNLTIMGNAVISASHFDGAPVGTNTAFPTGLNEKQMEGLTADFAGDTKVMYGGPDDNDDSGSIRYLSLRYGGKVIGLGNELNGLSLGGIGRETDISHVEIMNNVDDGIEIWGGTVNIKYASIWNVGDDSFDIDQGWRGKAQFIFIVQGSSADASQGSGVGDNCFEVDGAEDSDAQPVTTGVVYNSTVIGQPVHGDGGTVWRDNARMQYRNSIFMDLGEKLVRPDNIDGDGAQGYGYNGTLTFAQTWTTDAGTHSLVNAISPVPAAGAFNHPDVLYQTQVDGKLAEITDSVFFRNLASNAYTDATTYGVFDAANNNVIPAYNSSNINENMPIKALVRGPAVTRGGLIMLPIVSVDPRAANDALTAVKTAPADGFFTPAPFRGAFSADNNWLAGWSAADAFGLIVTTGNASDPVAEISLTATTTFPTVDGVVYSVEESSDNVNWSPVSTVVGNGSDISVTDVSGFDSAKFYRAIAQ